MTAAGTPSSVMSPGLGAVSPVTGDSNPSTLFEDDLFGMFAESAVWGDKSSCSSTHEDNGAIPDDVYMNDINPLWLNWLNDSIERLPSGLDDIVPQQLPENKPAAMPDNAEASAKAPTFGATDDRTKVTLVSPLAPAAAGPPFAPVMMPMTLMCVPNSRIFVCAPRASLAAPAAAKSMIDVEAAARNADVDVEVDIDSYVPLTLQLVHPAVRALQRSSRHEALSRFREKKRRCQFKKTIRYESRRAYADVRPRIKGRFARRDELTAMRAAGTLPPL